MTHETEYTAGTVSRRAILRTGATIGTLLAVPTVAAQKDTPYVNHSVDRGTITMEFVNPTNWAVYFDYRVDGEDGESDEWTGEEISQGPLAGQDFGLRYNNVTVAGGDSETVTVTAAESVEYRLARGPEQNWYFDWVLVEPEQPTNQADCKNGSWEDYAFRNQGQCMRYVNTGKDSR